MCFCHLVSLHILLGWNNKTMDKVIWECLATGEHLWRDGSACIGKMMLQSEAEVKGSSGWTGRKWIVHLMFRSVSFGWFLSSGPSWRIEEGKGGTCSSLSNGHSQFTLSFVSQLGDLSTVSTFDSQVWNWVWMCHFLRFCGPYATWHNYKCILYFKGCFVCDINQNSLRGHLFQGLTVVLTILTVLTLLIATDIKAPYEAEINDILQNLCI